MKKQIPKPENWQDFESLCKKLWGEIWEIPYKIKKNGRIGQPQSGVDIYGIPKGKTEYWGIQCKGKDEYTHAKLTENEIDQEIEKAKNFMPKLEVFIIATTSNKDSKIEEYVRLLDIDSRKNNEFEIILFCWEDIADLIEENRSTFQYYINNSQFKDKYDFEVSFSQGGNEKVINPKFHRKIKKWVLKSSSNRDLFYQIQNIHRTGILGKQSTWYGRIFENTNTAICEFEIKMKNTGSVVIENWHLIFNLIGEHKPVNEMRYQARGMPYFGFDTMKREIVVKSEIKFNSGPDYPLIQEDEENCAVEIIPLPNQYEITVEWELRARDFQKRGDLTLKVEPVFEDEIDYILVDNESELKEIEVISIRENKYEIDENKEETDL